MIHFFFENINEIAINQEISPWLQQLIVSENKKLGEIKEVEIRFDRYRKQASGKEHKENPDLPGSGTLHDLGAHLIDQAVQLFGFPVKLFADITSLRGKEFANDYFEIILFYQNHLRNVTYQR